MDMRRFVFLMLGVVLINSISACGGRTTKKNNEESYTQEELTNQKSNENSASFNPAALNRIATTKSVLYLDCSKSMAGYIESNNSSVFNNVIAGLLYRNDSSTAHLFDLKEQVSIPRDSFIEMVNNKKINWASESNLGKMINAMAENFTSGRADISYLLTDGIMSGTDAQIRADREYNKTHYGYSQEEIESALRKCGNNVAVLVVQYISGFTTNSSKQYYYYCYDNSHVNLKDAPRPFYIVALGTLDSIKKLESDIINNSRLSSFKNILLLGDKMPYPVDFKPAYNKGASYKGEENQDGKIIPVFAIDKGVRSTDLVFLNVRLDSLRGYMIDEQYLKENGFLFSKSSKSPNAPEYQISQSNYSQSVVNNVLSIGIASEKLRGTILSYRISYSLPLWVSISSTLDDKNVANEITPKTFNFKYFIDALSVVNKSHLSPGGYINKTDEVKFK